MVAFVYSTWKYRFHRKVIKDWNNIYAHVRVDEMSEAAVGNGRKLSVEQLQTVMKNFTCGSNVNSIMMTREKNKIGTRNRI